jgi:hypothetical protein
MNKKKRPLLLKIWGVLTSPRRLISVLGARGYLNWMPDALYLKIVFPMYTGYKLDLRNPKTFNEKLQWLKLYDRNPAYTQMVDKYGVREYIAKKIGEEYLIPLLGVWERFEDIDFSQLPDQFVLKPTHDSGSVVICKDKSKLDISAAQKKINKSLKRNFYYMGREWPYKNVKPRIIAEKYMADESGELKDYKFYCFNGVVDCVMVCFDRKTGDTKYYFFDNSWNLKRINKRGKEAPENFTLTKPKYIDKMFSLAETLSTEIPYVRVDLYELNSKIYFGELTFYPSSGFDPNYLKETDEYFGNLINFNA